MKEKKSQLLPVRPGMFLETVTKVTFTPRRHDHQDGY
jgi:hypothetical protein